MSFSISLHRRHRTCRRTLWAIVCTLVIMPPWSYAAGVSFDDAQRLAIERAPMLKVRQSQVIATHEKAARAAALPDPRLTLGLANWPVTGNDAFDLQADDMTMKQIGVMQAFPAHAKRQALQKVAERGIEQAQALSMAEQLAVRRRTAEAWIDLWAAQREVAALHLLREPATVAVRTARARLAGGVGTPADALASQAAALELDNRIDSAQAMLEVARAALARWLDVEPAEVEAEGAPPDLMELPVAAATLLSSIDQQGALLPWRAREALAEAQVDAAIAGKRPDWSLGMTYGRREHTPAGVPLSDMLMIEFAIDLPLFPRNRQDRDVAARRAERDAVVAERDEAERVQTEAVRRALAQWQGLQRQVTRMESASLPLARDRASTALALYAGGGELQPWLEARRAEIELHVEHARHLGELARTWAALAYLLPEEEMP